MAARGKVNAGITSSIPFAPHLCVCTQKPLHHTQQTGKQNAHAIDQAGESRLAPGP